MTSIWFLIHTVFEVSLESVIVYLGKMTLTAEVCGYKLRHRQCSFNLSLWRVRVTLVAMDKQQCVSRLTYTFDYSLPRVAIETRQKMQFRSITSDARHDDRLSVV